MTCMVARFTVSGDRPAPRHREPTGPYLSTAGSGKPNEAVDEHHSNTDSPDLANTADVVENQDIARQALTQAQYLTRNSPEGVEAGRRRRARRSRRDGGRPSGLSGPGPDERDPQAVRGLLDGLVDERGWKRPLAEARVFADWATLVGSDIAGHCSPATLRDGQLRIEAESTAWATQLQLMASTLLATLVRELGPQVVTKVYITGPTGPTWKHGGWSVRGARGPRDTYG
jgi:predicted nucleic acid-binding Zn ribbon protein